MKFRIFFGALILVMAGTVAGGANATLITETYTFYAETTGPISHHQGEITYTWNDDTNSLHLNSFDLMLGNTHFTLANVGVNDMASYFTIGGISSPGDVGSYITTGTDDFRFVWIRGLGAFEFAYSLDGHPSIEWGCISLGKPCGSAAVPEPASLGLIGAGLTGVGMASWRRRKRSA